MNIDYLNKRNLDQVSGDKEYSRIKKRRLSREDIQPIQLTTEKTQNLRIEIEQANVNQDQNKRLSGSYQITDHTLNLGSQKEIENLSKSTGSTSHRSKQIIDDLKDIDLSKMLRQLQGVIEQANSEETIIIIRYLVSKIDLDSLLNEINKVTCPIAKDFRFKIYNIISFNNVRQAVKDNKKLKIFNFIPPSVMLSHWKMVNEAKSDLSENYLNTTFLYKDSRASYDNKIFYQFFLDKACISYSKEKGAEGWDLNAVAEVILLVLYNFNKKSEKISMQSLTYQTLIDFESAIVNIDQSNIDRFQQIRSLEVGKFIFFKVDPVADDSGCVHYLLLCITRKQEESYTVCLYNTGLGIEKWHNVSKSNSHRFQTFYQIDDVAFEKLDVHFWTNLDSLLCDCESYEASEGCNVIYEFINKELNEGLPPNVVADEKFFDLEQQSGTCSTQCFYAALKHKILTQSSNYEENLIDYKLTKGLLQREIFEIFKHTPWQEFAYLKDQAFEKLRKTERHLLIKNIANDDVTSQIAISIGIQELDDFDLVCYFGGLKIEQISQTERFIVLSKLYESIVENWIVKKKDFSLNYLQLDPVLEPAFIYYQEKIKMYKRVLDDYCDVALKVSYEDDYELEMEDEYLKKARKYLENSSISPYSLRENILRKAKECFAKNYSLPSIHKLNSLLKRIKIKKIRLPVQI